MHGNAVLERTVRSTGSRLGNGNRDGAHTDADPNAHADTSPHADANTDANTDTDPDAQADGNANADPRTGHADTKPDADARRNAAAAGDHGRQSLVDLRGARHCGRR